MPRAGWLATGVVGAALVAAQTARPPPAALVVVALVLAACCLVAASGGGRSGPLRWTALGALLLVVRVLAGSLGEAPASAMATAALPGGSGPWTAVVESLGSPREGQQVVTLALEGPPIRVAATLPANPHVAPGSLVAVTGGLRPPPDGDYGTWLRRTGIAATLRARSARLIEAGPRALDLEQLRRRSDEGLASVLPEPAAGLASGILIGLRDRVDRDLAADFTAAGVSHIVAISGWNIAIVGGCVAALLRRRPRRVRSLVTLAAIVLYTAFAGGSPSVVRAATMAGVVLLAREGGRAARAAAALGLAAAVLVLVDPDLVGDAGFQLSAVATAGLLVWAEPIGRVIDRIAPRAPAWLRETLAMSLAAQLATLPVVLGTFGRLSLVAPAANLMVAPLVAPAMAAGALALLGGWTALLGAPPAVATLVALPAWFALSVLIALVDLCASVPFASVELPDQATVPAAAASALIALGLLPAVHGRVGALLARGGRTGPRTVRGPRTGPLDALGSPASPPNGATGGQRRRRVIAVVLALAVAAVGVAAIRRPDGLVRLSVLDVGQGDAVLVEGDRGGRLLVDGGPDPGRLLVELDGRIPPWDRRIDLVVLTHPHEDHVAGIPLLLERYRVGRVLETGMPGPGPGYAAMHAVLAAEGRASERLSRGDVLRIDSIRLDVLWPDADRIPTTPPDDGRAINDVSIVLLGSVGAGRFLLTGDVEDDVDPELIARGLPRVDILKVAHHGSRTATSAPLVDTLRPAVAIVSVGEGNDYGHPAPETLDRLAAVGASIVRTDVDGTVTAAYDGRSWAVTADRVADVSAMAATVAVGVPGAGTVAAIGERRPPRTRETAGRYHRRRAPRPSHGGRRAAADPRPTPVASTPFARRRRGRRLARPARAGRRPRHRPRVHRGRSAAPRRRQAAVPGRSRP